MRIRLVDTPRNISYIPKFQHLILRVISGSALIGRDRESVSNGGGLPVAVTDNIVNLEWDTGYLWMAATPAGTESEVEVIVP